MRKFLLPGILAVFALFVPTKSQSVPLDVPIQIQVSTVSTNGILTISTTTFPSGSSTVNGNVATYQWCIEHFDVSCASASNFSIYWSTSSVTAGTTDYMATTTAGVPYDSNFSYRTPYCAPIGSKVLTLKSSVAASTITAQGYLWKGWNP